MSTQDEGLKFLSSEVKNFKGIVYKNVDIAGRSLVIIGSNSEDKSSWIQSLLSPLDSKWIPDQPITLGEEKGEIILKIGGVLGGEKKEYTIKQEFTSANQKGKMTVRDIRGDSTGSNCKTFLSSLIGNIGFDPFKFIRDTPAKQIAELMKFMTQADKERYSLLGDEKKVAQDRVTYLTERYKEADLAAKDHAYTDDQKERYSVKDENESVLNAELANVQESLESFTKVEQGIVSRSEKIQSAKASIVESNEEIARLEKEIQEHRDLILARQIQNETLSNEIKAGEEWLKVNKKPSVAEITLKLNAVKEHNRHHEAINALAKKSEDARKIKEEIEAKAQEVKDKESARLKIIAESKIPVDGITWDDKEIYLNNLPFNEKQINKAKIIETGVRIGMALNPTLKVVIIWDGSLLDKQSYSTILKLCVDNGYQLLMERVSWEEKELTINFAEEVVS